jgi:glycosyltransferase involved in cell wall biosynthesis
MAGDSCPTISVIVPTHNRPKFLDEALQSIFAQTTGNWEVIVVDDASDPPAKLPALEGQSTRIVRHSASHGGAAAKNTGAGESRGEILAFLDDDDLYATTYISRALGVLDRHPEVQVVFMGVSWFGSGASWAQQAYRTSMTKTLAAAQWREIEPGVLRFNERLVSAIIERVPMAFQRPVVRRDAFTRIGGYRERCLLWDCDWAIRAAMSEPVALIGEGLYLQRAEGQGYSSQPDRRLAHVLSVIEIQETLLKFIEGNAALSRWKSTFSMAAANSWFNLAYLQCLTGHHKESFVAWCHSQRHCLRPSQIKFLIRLLLDALRLAKQAELEDR